ncbi:hypothetical protein [Lysobacter gummosus]
MICDAGDRYVYADHTSAIWYYTLHPLLRNRWIAGALPPQYS